MVFPHGSQHRLWRWCWHGRLPIRAKAWLELYDILLCVLPFVAVILIFTAPFVQVSFELGEISSSPGGLPFRWVIKGMLFIGFFLLALAALSRLSRVWALLFGATS